MWETIIFSYYSIIFLSSGNSITDFCCNCTYCRIMLLDGRSRRLSVPQIGSYAEEYYDCKNDNNGNNKYHFHQCETFFRLV